MTQLSPSLQEIASCVSGYDPSALPVAQAKLSAISALNHWFICSKLSLRQPTEAADDAESQRNSFEGLTE